MGKVTIFRPKNRNGKPGYYYAKWRDRDGKYKRKSLDVTDRELAKDIKEEMEKAIAREHWGILDDVDFTPNDAWDEYTRLTRKSEADMKHDRSYWDQFFAMTGLPTIRSVRRADVVAWQKQLMTKEVRPNKPVSVNTKTRTIAAVYSRLIKEDVYDGQNPFARRESLDEGAKKIRVIEWAVVETLLEAAKAKNRDLYLVVVLGVLMGLRKAEILAARWEHVNWKRREFHVVGTKTAGSDDIIHLHDAALDRLLPYRQAGGYIVKPEKQPGTFAYRWEFRKMWEALCSDMKIPEARVHDLRHSFATRLLDLSYPMKDIARMLRHASTRMTERYADLRTVKVKLGRIDAFGSPGGEQQHHEPQDPSATLLGESIPQGGLQERA